MRSQPERFDLVVIGGGPGGSTASTLVAMRGHKVLLLEKEKFPRHQIGESLLPVTIHALCPLLGVDEAIKKAGFVKKFGALLRWGKNEKPWHVSFNMAPDLEKAGADYAYQVERSRFDAILLDNARQRGVEVREQQTVKDVVIEDDRVTGVRYVDQSGAERVASAQFVVDASGNGSPLQRSVGERIYSQFFRNVALYCYFNGAKRLSGVLSGNVISATFPEGWLWFIPLSDTLTSVGAVISREHARELQNDHDSTMRGFIESCPIINDLLSGATRVTDGQYGTFRIRKDYSYINSSFWRPGLSLVGDAACFVDPIFSTGVHLATYSGLLAARSVNTVLSGALDEAACFVEFERRYRAEFENIYRFLLAFYDFHQDEQSYFWTARKILNTTERANAAFVRLISGISTVESNIFELGSRVSAHLKAFESGADQEGVAKANRLVQSHPTDLRIPGVSDDHREPERPRDEGGLIPSADGLHWTMPSNA
jgi:halogenation protein CepH